MTTPITFRALKDVTISTEEEKSLRICRVIHKAAKGEEKGESKSVGAKVPFLHYTDYIRWIESDLKIQEFCVSAFEAEIDKAIAALVKGGKQAEITGDYFTTKAKFLEFLNASGFGRLSGEKIKAWFADNLAHLAIPHIQNKALKAGKVLSEDAVLKTIQVLCDKFELLAARKVMLDSKTLDILTEYLSLAEDSEMKTKLQEVLETKQDTGSVEEFL